MLANIEIIKGNAGHTVVVRILERVMNRLAQMQEILSKITCAFISISYQLLFKNLMNHCSDYSVPAIHCHLFYHLIIIVLFQQGKQ